LAAIALAVGGIGLALWINAFSFLAVMAAVVIARISTRRGEKRPVWRALADGVRFARANDEMRRMLVVMTAVVLIASPFIAFVPQVATNVLGGEEGATSLLVTAQGVGAVTAAFTLGGLTRRFGLRRVMLGASALLCPALVLYGASPSLLVAAPALMVVGLFYGWSFTSFAGVAQATATDEIRGRVLSVNMFVLGLFYPIGTLIQGELADQTSLSAVTIGSGLVLAGVLLIRWVLDRPAE
jgi:predicted MFS family arabinose efflux permease